VVARFIPDRPFELTRAPPDSHRSPLALRASGAGVTEERAVLFDVGGVGTLLAAVADDAAGRWTRTRGSTWPGPALAGRRRAARFDGPAGRPLPRHHVDAVTLG